MTSLPPASSWLLAARRPCLAARRRRRPPPVATPTVSLSHDRRRSAARSRSPTSSLSRNDADLRRGLPRVRARRRRRRRADVDRRSRSADADHAVEAGQTIEYTRTMFVPVTRTSARPRSRSGCTDPATGSGCRSAARTSGSAPTRRRTLELLPQTENIFIRFKDGWHPAEVAADECPGRVAVDEEGGDAGVPEPEEGRHVLPRLRQPAGPRSTRRRQVTVRIGDQVARHVRADDQRGADAAEVPDHGGAVRDAEDMVELTIEVDQTFVPADSGGQATTRANWACGSSTPSSSRSRAVA